MKPSIVLVVEDEALLRMDAADLLSEAGHTVLEAANADEAIALLEVRKDITVVLTDVEMPGSMDGLRLARAVRDRWPPVTIIVVSGRLAPGKADLPDGVPFLSKPYAPSSLLGLLERL
ncbi:response regulator [Bosea thiooxidans]